MYQIYRDNVSDMLAPKSSTDRNSRSPWMNLDIREVPGEGAIVFGLTKHLVGDLDEIMAAINAGLKNRASASASINESSSRSHAILQFHFSIENDDDKQGGRKLSIRRSRLLLVDLAGSERAIKSESIGNPRRISESHSINKSISTLGLCIHLLSSYSKKGVDPVHIPFRDCKLTRLLAEVGAFLFFYHFL
jgi:hypothetical protein